MAGLAAPLAAVGAPGDPIVAVPHLNVDSPDQTDSIARPGGSADLTTAMTVTQVNSVADVVFVIDTTESMNNAITAVKAGLAQFAQNLADAGGTDLAFGVFAFGDSGVSNPWSTWSPSLTPLTSTYTVSDIVRAINSATRFNGGDGPEDSLLALATVAAETPWRDGSQREIILVTDWGSHVRNCPYWCVNGMKADLAGVQTLVADANAHVTVVPINQGYTALDQSEVPLATLAGAFGETTLVDPTAAAVMARLTNDVIVQNGAVSPMTVTGDLSITYADGTTSSDVTATVTPTGDTTISPGTPVPFTIHATASANPVRPGATTTVCVEYKLAGTDTVVARQTITFVAPTTVTIVFHDDTSGTNVTPLSGFVSSYTGNPGDSFSFTATDAAAGFDGSKYVFVSLNPVTSFTVDPQTVTVHLKHLLVDSTVTSSRTINYTGAGALTPADHFDSVSWTKTTDAVTSAVTGCTTSDTGYPAVTSPTITGYSVDRATVAAEPAPVAPSTCPPANSSTTVTYTVIPTGITIVFHDDDSNTTVAPSSGFVSSYTGNPGDTFSFTATDAAAGFDGSKYVFVSLNPVTSFTFDPQTVTVHLKHL
ncbi:MAG: VWA domain-containing protein, partial [Propionibacteriaceae bacterium]|nr:VWA domain-containing protein [Propionibacteriaceae bacterium]